MISMLKIRLQRIGKINQAHFRVVVADSKIGPKSGKFLEILGFYNPKTKDLNLKEDRIKHWMSHGAQVSDTVHNFLIDKKIIQGKKINVLPRKSSTLKKKEIKAGPKVETPAPKGAEKNK